MPSTREIRRRIGSVKNIGKVTKAMETVAASKMRKAQQQVLATRPYAEQVLGGADAPGPPAAARARRSIPCSSSARSSASGCC